MNSNPIVIEELDFFFMSYDEPNAEKHWTDLLTKVPWAKRVHGIKGFDAVHRECGRLATTPYLITVDADTIVHNAFLELKVPLPINGAFNAAWASRNAVNGLRYANGGVKIWSKDFASTMAFHELGNTIDFCWDTNFTSIPKVMSDLYINGSALQAFRAGYREGVKLSTQEGKRVAPNELHSLPSHQLHLLKVWCSIGADAGYGQWAITGARKGLIDTLAAKEPVAVLTGFDHIQSVYESLQNESPTKLSRALGLILDDEYGCPVPDFTAEQSQFIKDHFTPC